MIIGLGIDVVQVSRLEAIAERRPAALAKILTEQELEHNLTSCAARFAAKEALAKALGSPGGMRWRDAEVINDEQGRPRLVMHGTVAAVARRLGVNSVHLSISHDAGVAVACVVCEG